jgi:transcriptional regulator with XRE-family HTH domain
MGISCNRKWSTVPTDLSTVKGWKLPIKGWRMKGDIYRQIGAKIRKLRAHHRGKGISQEELAAEVGTTPNTISRWETAQYKPSVADLEKLAKFFGVPITAFLPSIESSAGIQALLSAAGDLDDDEMEELTNWALFRKARRELKKHG